MPAFQDVYEYAKEENGFLLGQFLNSNPCIDVFSKGSLFVTPAALHAYEGNYEAVMRLILRGADVNYVARMAAMKAQHRAFLNNLCEQYAIDWNYVAQGMAVTHPLGKMRDLFFDNLIRGELCPFFLAQGAAFGGSEDLVNYLMVFIHPTDKRDLPSLLATNYALGGHKKLAIKLVEEKEASLNGITFAAAVINDSEWVSELEQWGALPKYAAQGFAQGGHEQEALACLERANNKKEILHSIIQGAAIGGHHTLLTSLRLQYAELDVAWVIAGAQLGRHTLYVERLEEENQARLKNTLLNDEEKKTFLPDNLTLCTQKQSNQDTSWEEARQAGAIPTFAATANVRFLVPPFSPEREASSEKNTRALMPWNVLN